jgi:hypothetical protein
MKVVYIAGPFRGRTAWDIECNVRRAEECGLLVAQLRAMPLIPHANTRFFHGQIDDDFWLQGTLALLENCDAIYLIPGWEESSGAKAEAERAAEIGIPVFTTIKSIRFWLTGR